MATTKTEEVLTHDETHQLLEESLGIPAPKKSSDAPAPVSSFIKILSSTSPVTSKTPDDAAAELEAENVALLDQVKELQFTLGITLIMLINILLFEKFMNSATSLVIFAIFEAGLILIAANRFGIPELWKIFTRLTSAMAKRPQR